MTEQPTPRTYAGKRLLARERPGSDPSRCPLNAGGEHETYGGICHCGWSLNNPTTPGRAKPLTDAEFAEWIVAVEDDGDSQAPDHD